MRLCAHALISALQLHPRQRLTASEVICNPRSLFQWILPQSILLTTLRKIKKEQDILNIESHAELLNASKRQRLTDDMSPKYWNTILVTLASGEQYKLTCRFIVEHAKHSLHPKLGESTHPLHDARRRIWVEGESVTRTQSHDRR